MPVLGADAPGRAAGLGVAQSALVRVLLVGAVGLAAVEDDDGGRVLAPFATPELLKVLVTHGCCGGGEGETRTQEAELRRRTVM